VQQYERLYNIGAAGNRYVTIKYLKNRQANEPAPEIYADSIGPRGNPKTVRFNMCTFIG